MLNREGPGGDDIISALEHHSQDRSVEPKQTSSQDMCRIDAGTVSISENSLP